VAGAGQHLTAEGEAAWDTYFGHHGLGDLRDAPLVRLTHGRERLDALLTRRRRPALEGAMRRLDRRLDIRGRGGRDARHLFFGRRIDDRDLVPGVDGLDPPAVDVEPACVCH
jgi:hypothetical protein